MKRLGHYLLEMGATTQDVLEAALARQQESGALLGAVLREQGAISESALDLALALQRQDDHRKQTLTMALQRIMLVCHHARLTLGRPVACAVLGLLAGAVSFPIVFYFFSGWAWSVAGLQTRILPVVAIAAGTMALVMLVLALELFVAWLSQQTTRSLLHALVLAVHRQVLLRPIMRHDSATEAAVTGLYSQNIEQFALNLELISNRLPRALGALLVFVLILLLSQPAIALMILALAPLTLIIPPWVSSHAQPFLVREGTLLGTTLARLTPFFRHFRTSRGHLLERSQARIRLYLDEHHLNQACKWWFWNSSFNVASFFNLLVLTSILVVGGWLVLRGAMSPGALFSLFLAVSFMLPRFNDIYDSYFYLQAAGQHGKLILEQLRSPLPAGGGPEDSPVHSLSIEVRELRAGQQRLLEGLKLTLRPGQLYLVTGESGVGKSTLARLLAGVQQAPGVTVTLENAAGERSQRVLGRVAYVGQNHLFLDALSVAGNVLCSSRPQPHELQRVSEELEALRVAVTGRLDDDGVAMNEQFSGGEKQRMHVLQGLLAPCLVRLFDEPTASLDPTAAERLKQRLAQVPADEIRLVISHDHEWPVPPSHHIHLSTISPPSPQEAVPCSNTLSSVPL